MDVKFKVSKWYQNEVFWDVTTFSAVNRYKSFEGTCLLNYTMSHPERLKS